MHISERAPHHGPDRHLQSLWCNYVTRNSVFDRSRGLQEGCTPLIDTARNGASDIARVLLRGLGNSAGERVNERDPVRAVLARPLSAPHVDTTSCLAAAQRSVSECSTCAW